MSLDEFYTEAFDHPLAYHRDSFPKDEFNLLLSEEPVKIAEALGMAHGYQHKDFNEVLPVLKEDWPWSDEMWNLFEDTYKEAWVEGRDLKKHEGSENA